VPTVPLGTYGPLAELIGRSEALDEARRALDEARVVTITGPAGVGKTSLAETVAKGEAETACFCDLSDARALDSAHSALAAAMGARLVDVKVADEAAERLAQGLADRGLRLLVLDNCEHIADAARALVELALDVEGMRVIVTSREPLGRADERVIALPQLDAEAAVELLFERAKQVLPSLQVDDAAREIAARVVEKLDRLPLAIELFAARLDLLTLPELEQRLDKPLAVLRASRPEGRPPRHADVAAAIRCSWDLLDDDEALVLRALSLFRGGTTTFVLEAALGELGYGGALLDDLARLRRRYLLFLEREPGVEVRYHLLETVRAFVRSVIEEEGRADELAVAHARAVVEHSPSADNLARALRRCGDIAPELAARAGLRLHAHMLTHGPMHAHLDMLDEAIAAAEAAGEPALSRELLTARGDMRRKVGRLHAAGVDLDEAMAHAEDDAGRATVLSSQAMLRMVEGDLDDAAALIGQAVELADGVDDAHAAGVALERGGAVHLLRGNYPLVEEYCQRALSALETTGDVRALTNTYTYLGIGRLDRGDRDATRRAFEEAKRRYAEADDAWSIPVCDAYLAVVLVDEGDLDAAIPRLEAARADARKVGHVRLELFVDGVLGVAHHLRGELDEAVACCRRGVGLALKVKDILGGCIAAGHLAGALAARGGALDEARHWMTTANDYAQLMPNPSGRAALAALEGLIALAEDDPASAASLRERAGGAGLDGVHLRLALRILDDALQGVQREQQQAHVIVSESGRRLVINDEEIDLTRRGPLRKILCALARAHAEAKAFDVYGLIEAGWPGEFVSTEAGAARVYAAVKSLRRLGLEGILITRDDGYVLSPDARVEVVPDAA
jgi:predicted ATPase